MKSERRHELATNELADWLGNIPEWWEQNGKVVITAVVAVAVIIAIWYFAAVRTAAARAEQGQKLSGMLYTMENLKYRMVRSPESRADLSSQMILLAGQLKAFADGAANQNAGAFALIKSAEAVRAAAHYSSMPIDAEAEAKDLASAKTSCEKAISLIKDDPSLLASATLQLGLCQEGLGNFDEARKTYKGIVNDPQFTGDAATAQAAVRLAFMDDFREMVVLAAPPAPAAVAMPPMPARVVPEPVVAEANLPAATK
jgi:predicted negative regulator of RcsB-dependent stress response